VLVGEAMTCWVVILFFLLWNFRGRIAWNLRNLAFFYVSWNLVPEVSVVYLFKGR